jgi:F-type H+-transporting ATPase subunit a
MPEQLWFTKLLNHNFGTATTVLLHHVGIHPAYPNAPINNTVAMEVLVCLILIAFFVVVRARMSVQNPGGLQHTVEMLDSFINEQAKQVIGHHYERYVPYVTALGFFILIGNLLGLVPGFESPTANASVPLACALTTFIYYNFHGIRHHGASYIKQFLGPSPGLAFLIFPIEIISHLARIMSLTIRLFANMFAGDMVTLAFFSLVPVLIPVAFLGLHLFVSFVQAFIFVILTMVYIGMAVSEEH